MTAMKHDLADPVLAPDGLKVGVPDGLKVGSDKVTFTALQVAQVLAWYARLVCSVNRDASVEFNIGRRGMIDAVVTFENAKEPERE